MKKETKKLILGIVLGIILVIIVNIIFPYLLTHSSEKFEIRYYKDGKFVGASAGDFSCKDVDSCRAFGADNYNFDVELGSSSSLSSFNCINEFEKRTGKKLDGFCDLENVLPHLEIFTCNCWSN